MVTIITNEYMKKLEFTLKTEDEIIDGNVVPPVDFFIR